MIARYLELCKSWCSWNLKVHKTLAAFLDLLINQLLFIYLFIFTYIKLSKNSWAKSCWYNKEILQKMQQFGDEGYENLSEDKTQRLVEYRKKYCKIRKNASA